MARPVNPNADSRRTSFRRKSAALVSVASMDALADPPAWMMEDAKAIWAEVGNDLIRTGILSSLDLGVFADYCQVSACLLEIEKQMQDARESGVDVYGIDNKAISGIAMAHLKYIKQRQSLANELGLSPAGRAKVKASPKADATEGLLAFERRVYGD